MIRMAEILGSSNDRGQINLSNSADTNSINIEVATEGEHNELFKRLLVIVSGRTSSPHIVQSRFFDESSVKNATTSNYSSVCNSLSSVQFELRRVDNKSSHHNSI
jgi:hypothetical protein